MATADIGRQEWLATRERCVREAVQVCVACFNSLVQSFGQSPCKYLLTPYKLKPAGTCAYRISPNHRAAACPHSTAQQRFAGYAAHGWRYRAPAVQSLAHPGSTGNDKLGPDRHEQETRALHNKLVDTQVSTVSAR